MDKDMIQKRLSSLRKKRKELVHEIIKQRICYIRNEKPYSFQEVESINNKLNNVEREIEYLVFLDGDFTEMQGDGWRYRIYNFSRLFETVKKLFDDSPDYNATSTEEMNYLINKYDNK